jgi:hypothetical protein
MKKITAKRFLPEECTWFLNLQIGLLANSRVAYYFVGSSCPAADMAPLVFETIGKLETIGVLSCLAYDLQINYVCFRL